MSRPEFDEGAALVVGGSGGIGGAVAERLAARGCDVAITYRGRAQAAEDVAARCRAFGRRATVHQLDLGDEAACASVVADAVAAHGAVHAWVHAAGSTIDQPYVADVEVADLLRVLDADVAGFLRVLRPVVRHFRARGGGAVVYVSTAGLDRFPPGDILSIAPKGSVEALVRGLAREEGRHNIRANSVGIGVFEGGMFPDLVARGELDEAWIAAAKKNVALRRFGQPDEVAEAIAFLASNRASYVTGQRLGLDGGYTL